MNCDIITLSNSFRVRDNNEAQKVFEDLGFNTEIDCDDKLIIFAEDISWADSMIAILDKNTNKYVGGYDSSYCEANEFVPEVDKEPERYEEVELETFIKDILVNNEVFVLKENWNEGFRYSGAWAIMISKDEIRSINLDTFIQDNIEKMKNKI